MSNALELELQADISCQVWEPNSAPLGKQQVFWTAEPPLQAPESILMGNKGGIMLKKKPSPPLTNTLPGPTHKGNEMRENIRSVRRS